MTNILLIGSGGREHAIALALLKSPRLGRLYVAPGNPGIAEIATCVPISELDFDALISFARDTQIDLVFVGPETPLVLGIVDRFESENIAIVGPNQIAAQLEGSKEWAKEKMKAYGIPTASFEVFRDYTSAAAYIQVQTAYPIVLKADGLAAGKGVTLAYSESEALSALHECFIDHKFGAAGATVVIESFLVGEEASLFAFSDGRTIKPMLAAQDHKAIFDGDKGPNTGGMGAYCPAPLVTPLIYDRIVKQVLNPLIEGFQKDGIVYKGIIYAGLMIAPDGEVSVVEFNCRFGDPETQVVLPLLDSDLLTVFESISKGTLSECHLKWSSDFAVCVVLASGGYPGSYATGHPISGISVANSRDQVHVIHAGTVLKDGVLLTHGGRVLGVVARDHFLNVAIDKAYMGVSDIYFDGIYYRNDIGFKAFSS